MRHCDDVNQMVVMVPVGEAVEVRKCNVMMHRNENEICGNSERCKREKDYEFVKVEYVDVGVWEDHFGCSVRSRCRRYQLQCNYQTQYQNHRSKLKSSSAGADDNQIASERKK